MPLSDDDLLLRFERVQCWERDGVRAPHKAFVLLLALARIQQGLDPWLEYERVESQIADLLRGFGPPRARAHPNYPFWRLRNDPGLWVIDRVDDLARLQNRTGDLSEAALRREHARAALDPDVRASLESKPGLLARVAGHLIAQVAAPSRHEELTQELGLTAHVCERHRRNGGAFRREILRIYEHRCAVCGYDARLGSNDLGLEAAHVRWWSSGGPCEASNGLALCTLHHMALDRGALGLSEEGTVLVSEELHGSGPVHDMLIRFAGATLRRPLAGAPSPAREFVSWHQTQVFVPPARACPA